MTSLEWTGTTRSTRPRCARAVALVAAVATIVVLALAGGAWLVSTVPTCAEGKQPWAAKSNGWSQGQTARSSPDCTR
jgi:hypothetical protein